MKIVVCVKRVPDTATKIKIAADARSIDCADIEYEVSPYDAIAVEHAIRLKEKGVASEVVVISNDSSEQEKFMRTCLAMGADRGIICRNSNGFGDALAVARTLHDAIQSEKPDLLLFGIKAVDSDNAQVGAMVATLLDIPFITSVTTFEVAEGKVTAQSEIEGARQTIEAPVPCALSIQKSKVEPRICSLMNIRKAKKKELKKQDSPATAASIEIVKMELPPQRSAGEIIGKDAEAVPELFRRLKEQAKVL